MAIYILADVGSVMGGWGSSRLLSKGVSANIARKSMMFVAALCVVPVGFAMFASNLWLAVVLIGLACAGHQGFSTNLFALPSDLFPRWASGAIVGFGGAAGALGSMLMAKFAGWVLQTTGSYAIIFIVAACAYLIAFMVVQALVPRYEPVRAATLAGEPA